MFNCNGILRISVGYCDRSNKVACEKFDISIFQTLISLDHFHLQTSSKVDALSKNQSSFPKWCCRAWMQKWKTKPGKWLLCERGVWLARHIKCSPQCNLKKCKRKHSFLCSSAKCRNMKDENTVRCSWGCRNIRERFWKYGFLCGRLGLVSQLLHLHSWDTRSS